MDKAFFISIPHSGEKVPVEASWLSEFPEPILMCDVDRYVDQLYAPAIKNLHVPAVICEWHRYAVDLNRLASDVDQNSVIGSANFPGSFDTGLHWVKTTTGHTLMRSPVTMQVHQQIVAKYFNPFHDLIQAQYAQYRSKGFKKIYHIDAHSMPSMGTAAHRDPGQKRAEIVISDFDGTSCEPEFKSIILEAFTDAGFQVAYNWPYKGGRLTQVYGKPKEGQHVIQVEINRSLYMDEISKKQLADKFKVAQAKIEKAVGSIVNKL